MNRARRLIGGVALAMSIAVAGAGFGAADPVGSPDVTSDQDGPPMQGPTGMPLASDGFGSADASADPVSQACDQFDAAISLAAANYEEFAYATAGDGNYVDYGDPNVQRTNIIGRTALREAAAAALSASRTPGLPPTVSDPIRAWSLHATKLLVVMGLRGGGDTLNSSAEQLNADATEAQFACAAARG